MAIRAYHGDDGPRIGVVHAEGVVPTRFTDLPALIAAGGAGAAGASPVAPSRRPLPILSAARQLLFCGFNYLDHLDENPDAGEPPATPFFFSKLPGALIGPGEPIVVPYPDCQVDYEAELAVVIGRRARRVAAAEAMEHVFGYTVVNDVTARDIQFPDAQHTIAKGVDSFCPASDVLVLRDELGGIGDLAVRSWVNGEPRQSSTTARQVFSVAEMIAFLSRVVTLEPGDVIATGTPAGVGHFRTPPAYLQPGDVVAVEVEGVGRIENPVIAGWEERA